MKHLRVRIYPNVSKVPKTVLTCYAPQRLMHYQNYMQLMKLNQYTLIPGRKIWVAVLAVVLGSVLYRLAVAFALSSGMFGLQDIINGKW